MDNKKAKVVFMDGLQSAQLGLQDTFEHHWNQLLSVAESPIEEIMGAALLFLDLPFFFKPDACLDKSGTFSPFVFVGKTEAELVELVGYPKNVEPGEGAILSAQVEILGYRVDFLLLVALHRRRELVRIVVEVDGHDFHERTKEQAKRDKGRDRKLTAAGYKVFHFTGSEVYGGASSCAAEIGRFLWHYEAETRP